MSESAWAVNQTNRETKWESAGERCTYPGKPCIFLKPQPAQLPDLQDTNTAGQHGQSTLWSHIREHQDNRLDYHGRLHTVKTSLADYD